MLFALVAGACRPRAEPASASCTADPTNAVRASCTISLSEPGPVMISFTDGDQHVDFLDSARVARHDVPIWGLTTEAEWTWSLSEGGASGSFRTGTLPEGLELEVDVERSGESAVADILLPTSCHRKGAYVVALDGIGRVRWYHDYASPTTSERAGINAFQWTEDDTVVGLVASEEWAEVDLAGRELVRVNPDLPLHHDLYHRNGLTYVLMADTYAESDGLTWVEDQVVAYDASGTAVATWNEHDHLVPSHEPDSPDTYWADVFPGARDAWHTNGLYVTEEGDLLLSAMRASSLFRVVGGEVGWVLAGDGRGVDTLPATLSFARGGDPEFNRQHHPALLPDGHITVFDNDHNRGLELSLDEAAGTAAYVNAWGAQGLNCDVQSSLFPVGDGHHLLACGTADQVLEYDAAHQLVTRTTITCGQDAPSQAIRGQPVDLWAARVGSVTASR